ncbi:MAG: phage tail protein [Deltaproteobacteria bacterium]
MATLVLSTVGSALGGPVGGAIGALIGQSFDQQLLGPARRGPRLGDLSVQSSSYGTQVPRVYGTMRLAGSVIWATDLVESSDTASAKGQPDVTYNYSVSLAVALSSRPLSSIKRIWADGKLLRGEEGDFKVGTNFRFYDGREDQAIDPLIGSSEGIANTPAYRGLALAVFENLELVQFGNRIPFLTFEVVADNAPPTIATVLADASRGAIECEADDTLVGYAAYGGSIRAAVRPLVDCYEVALFDDGSVVRSAASETPSSIGDDELGNAADDGMTPRIQREQLPASALPETLRITYYDPARDYQIGEARASSGEGSGNQLQQELAAVLDASAAKSLAQRMIARQWAACDKLTLRLPPSRMMLEPGSLVEPASVTGSWIVDKCTIDSFVTIVELRRSWRPSGSVAADPGRIVANPDIVEGPLSLALFDVPDVTGAGSDQPMLLLAASTSSIGWRSSAIDLIIGTTVTAVQTPRSKSILGRAATVLGAAEPELIDEMNSLDVELVDAEQWLTNCDDDALGSGMNLAVLGNELLQFAAVEPLGGGRFRLSRLLRGRAGTEWAIPGHSVGEQFCLIQANKVQRVALSASAIGSNVTAADRAGASVSVQVTGESVRPWSPVNLLATVESSGDVSLSWTRRSRTGLFWLDEVDVPLGENREQYRVTMLGALATVEFTCTEPALTIAATDVAAVGSGPAQVQLRQVGDWATSRAAQITINLP